jgi:polysaccharide biosynthesis transport protein
MAEAVRTLRTAIHFGLADGAADVILVTSPAPGDGKSTVASNLAIAMAQADQAVLLIDADFRKPSQHNIFKVSDERGLSTVIPC